MHVEDAGGNPFGEDDAPEADQSSYADISTRQEELNNPFRHGVTHLKK